MIIIIIIIIIILFCINVTIAFGPVMVLGLDC